MPRHGPKAALGMMAPSRRFRPPPGAGRFRPSTGDRGSSQQRGSGLGVMLQWGGAAPRPPSRCERTQESITKKGTLALSLFPVVGQGWRRCEAAPDANGLFWLAAF